ncbi:MurR/RpiR family transcriptional regulator [Neobacillus mesonae]|uniref:Transcriptional regulator n=1 Tax=Neobacillus mesonae TaxID=1193713 RepID=A0A3Q9QZR1_9BACI|nr:MurR/RpiR family transcriptional regulator [Neobacillus mesonae]AZU64408.1 transcriptional regulator [Neobacillus mesonae]MED4203503.1 MurR/RpiR family transcriptional regulator [Neobacillus mesonae]
MSTFKDKIKLKYPTLSSGHKKVGKYVLDYPQAVAMKSASQLGQDVGVSETTIIRFCYALEYSGYSELQAEIRQFLIFQKSSFQDYQAMKAGEANQPNFFFQNMQRDQAHIQKIIEQINEEHLYRVAKKIYDSDNILVAGVRTSFAVAHWLSFALNIVRGNAHLVQPGVDDINFLFSKLNNQSIFVAITFHRYSSMTLDLAKLAKKQGAYIIGITDSVLSPLEEFADTLLPINLSSTSTLDTGPAVLSLINAIVAGVAVIDKDAFDRRREGYEKFNPGKFLI